MSDRRDATERHYETPFEHLDREEHAEKAMLGWVVRALREQGETLDSVLRTQRTISRHLAAIERKLTGQSPEDQAALEAAKVALDAAETIIDRIEPDTGKGTL